MSAKHVHLNASLGWKSRTDALRYFQQLIGRYRVGDRICVGQDQEALVALVSYYDRSLPLCEPSKSGPGISHFTKKAEYRQGFGAASIEIHRIDGSIVAFSCAQAIRCGGASRATDLDSWLLSA